MFPVCQVTAECRVRHGDTPLPCRGNWGTPTIRNKISAENKKYDGWKTIYWRFSYEQKLWNIFLTFRMLTQDLSLFLQQFARIITFLLASLFYILCAKDLWGIEVIYHFSIQDEKEIFYLLSNTVKTRKRETLRLSAEEIKLEFYRFCMKYMAPGLPR